MEGSRADGTAEAGSSSQPDVPAEAPKRLKRPVKPDKQAHQTAVQTLQDELDSRRRTSDELQARIQAKRQSGGSPEIIEARNKVNALTASWRGEADKKSALREQARALDTERNALRAQIRDQRSKLGAFSTVQKIDERLHALEHRLTHTTIDLKDENRAREEMKKTAALKPLAAQHAEHQDKLKKSDKERESLYEQMKVLEDKINSIKGQEEQQKATLNDLRQKDAAKTQDLPSLLKERDECREVINALYGKIKQMRDEFKEKNNVFFQENLAFKEQLKQDKAERDAQREKEYQAKQAERQAQAAEFAGEPYHKEVGLCEQLLSHLAKHTPLAQPSNPTTFTGVKDNNSVFEGMKAVSKTSTDVDEFGAFMGSKDRKGKGAKKAAKQTSGSQIQGPQKQKLNHSLDIIDAFSKIKVSVPTTVDKVPAAIEEVEASKAYWMKKRQEAKETGVIPEEPSSSAPNGIPKTNKSSKQLPPANFQLDKIEWTDMAGNVVPPPEDAAADPADASMEGGDVQGEEEEQDAENLQPEAETEEQLVEAKSSSHAHKEQIDNGEEKEDAAKQDGVAYLKAAQAAESKALKAPTQKVVINMNPEVVSQEGKAE